MLKLSVKVADNSNDNGGMRRARGDRPEGNMLSDQGRFSVYPCSAKKL